MTPTINRNMGPTDWGLLLGLSVLWGGSFFFNGVIVRELPPLTTVASRLAGAAVVLLLAVRVLRIPLPGGLRTWGALLTMGVLNNVVPFCLIVWAQTQIASGLASILNATTPLFTVLVAHVLTRDEKLTAAKMAGVVLGLAGVVVMIGPEVLHGLGVDGYAQLACLAAAVSYAFAGIFGRRFKRMGLDPIATATGQVTTSAILLLPMALLVDRTWTLPAPTYQVWAALAGLAILSTALAYILFFRILSSAGATNVMLVTLLVPISAVLLGVTVLGETLQAAQLGGMALIACGLLAIDGRVINFVGRRRRALLSKEDPAARDAADI